MLTSGQYQTLTESDNSYAATLKQPIIQRSIADEAYRAHMAARW